MSIATRKRKFAGSLAATLLIACISTPAVRGDVFQWQWVDPNDHSQGKEQSTILCPGGAGIAPQPGAQWGGRDLTRAYLYQADLRGAFLIGCNFTEAYFRQATLSGLLTGHNFTDADFTDAVSKGGNYRFSNFLRTDFTRADLSNATFQSCSLINTSFRGANLNDANFFSGDISTVDFTDATINGAGLRGAFSAAQLYSTASYKNHDLRRVKLGFTDHSGLNLSQQDLTDARIESATLVGARFDGSKLNGALLGGDMTGADFSRASGSRATIQGNLTNATFVGADLSSGSFSYANLTNANLRDANLLGAQFLGANFTNADLTGTAVREASFESATGFTAAQLYSTSSYKLRDLRGINLGQTDLAGWDFHEVDCTGAKFGSADLTGANFRGAILRNAVLAEMNGTTLAQADFTGAVISGASVESSTRLGFTAEQFYSTASYQSRELQGVRLSFNDLSDWRFTNADLSNSSFYRSSLSRARFDAATLVSSVFREALLHDVNFEGSDLTGADFTAADLRGAHSPLLGKSTTTNAILPDGTIAGLRNDAGFYPVFIRNYQGAEIPRLYVQDQMALGQLALVQAFDELPWQSTIAFEPGIPVSLDGTQLHLTFAVDANPAALVGRTFQIFDWTGVSPHGQLNVTFNPDQSDWDISRLYLDGTVTLLAVPEPASCLCCAVVATLWIAARRRDRSRFVPYSS